jgi:uncharacterized protein
MPTPSLPLSLMPWALPSATAGLGLKHAQVNEVLASRPDLGFYEVHAENYLVDGGPLHQGLTRIREHYPLSLHGVGLSIGGPGPLDAEHLNRLAALIERYQPAQFSEHLAWSSHGEVFFNDLLPLPYTSATLATVCEHIDQVQTRLGRTMLLENPATYVEFHSATMSEGQFLSEVVRRTGCGLLLDVNNVYVSCTNHGRDPQIELAALPLHAVAEIHLAGFATDQDGAGAPLLIDHHGAPVDEAVWALYEQVITQLGPVPTLLERDNELPALSVLVAEAQRAQRMLRGLRQAVAA